MKIFRQVKWWISSKISKNSFDRSTGTYLRIIHIGRGERRDTEIIIKGGMVTVSLKSFNSENKYIKKKISQFMWHDNGTSGSMYVHYWNSIMKPGNNTRIYITRTCDRSTVHKQATLTTDLLSYTIMQNNWYKQFN